MLWANLIRADLSDPLLFLELDAGVWPALVRSVSGLKETATWSSKLQVPSGVRGRGQGPAVTSLPAQPRAGTSLRSLQAGLPQGAGMGLQATLLHPPFVTPPTLWTISIPLKALNQEQSFSPSCYSVVTCPKQELRSLQCTHLILQRQSKLFSSVATTLAPEVPPSPDSHLLLQPYPVEVTSTAEEATKFAVLSLRMAVAFQPTPQRLVRRKGSNTLDLTVWHNMMDKWKILHLGFKRSSHGFTLFHFKHII